MQRGNTGMVALQIPPEEPSQVKSQIPHCRVIEHWLAFGQVSDEEVTNWATGDGIAVDQLGRTELAAGAESPERRRSPRLEDAHLME